MSPQQFQYFTLRSFPARLNVEEVACLLGFKPNYIPILVAMVCSNRSADRLLPVLNILRQWLLKNIGKTRNGWQRPQIALCSIGKE